MQEINWRDLSSPEKNSTKAGSLRWTEVTPQTSLYDILQVASTASPEVIRAAYRALMEKYHPDKNPGHRRAMAEEVSRELNRAYSVLGNPQKRREYDHSHGIHRGA